MNVSPKDDSLNCVDPVKPREAARAETESGSAGFLWKTRAGLLGIPLICVAFGSDASGRMRVAKGFVAIGQVAVGGIAVAPLGIGIMAVGQLAVGVLALGQLALAVAAGFGQFSVGFFAVGQFVAGHYAMGQIGWAEYLWSQGRTDMEAVAMFETIRWLFSQPPGVVLENLKDALTLGI